LAAHGREQPVAGHREEDARLAVLEDEQHRAIDTVAPNATIQLAVGRPASSRACASGSLDLRSVYFTSPVATAPTIT
jgi:hypothetical protein